MLDFFINNENVFKKKKKHTKTCILRTHLITNIDSKLRPVPFIGHWAQSRKLHVLALRHGAGWTLRSNIKVKKIYVLKTLNINIKNRCIFN